MGTSESKSEYAVDAQQTSFCCDQNRKDSEKQRRKHARSKSSIGRNESVQMPSSIFTPWMAQPDQNDASHEAVIDKIVNLQDSSKPVILSENTSNSVNSIPTKKGVKTAALPPGWTSAQLINLKDAVHRTASVIRSKPPGFFAVQVS
jgi:hypothetical protein